MTQIEHISNTEKKATLTLSSEAIEGKLDEKAAELAPTLQLKGFRKGKVPAKIIKTRLRSELLRDAVGALVNDQITALEASENFQIADVHMHGEEEAIKGYVAGSDMELTAHLQVVPPLEDIKLDDIEIEWPLGEITEERITQRVDELRGQYAMLVPVEDRKTVVKDDTVTVDITLAFAEAPDARQEQKDVELEVGNRFSQALPFPAVMDLIEKATQGEAITETLKTPEGEDVETTVLIKDIKAKQLPELDAELMKKFGDFDDEAAFRAWVKEGLDFVQDMLFKDPFITDLTKKIAASASIEIPDAAVGPYHAHLWRTRYPNMIKLVDGSTKNLSQAEQQTLSELDTKLWEEAKEIRIGSAVVAKLREQLSIGEATGEEIDEYIARMADFQRQPVAKVRTMQPMDRWGDEAFSYKLLKAVKGHVKITMPAPKEDAAE